MKKRIIILIVILTLLVIGFILWNNMIISTITIDINPSIEINLKRNGQVKNVKALNDDAKDIVSNNLAGKTLEDALKSITDKVIENGYVEEGPIDILIHTKGKVTSEEIERKISTSFGEQRVDTMIIVIDTITKEDEKLAKKYHISSAKAAYINNVTKENEGIAVKDLINKPVSELKQTKETGNYCDEGYILEGDFCLKEKERITANPGKVCPDRYYDDNGICYASEGVIDTDELTCDEESNLNGKKCLRTITLDAKPSKYSCSKGEAKTRLELGLSSANDGNAQEVLCVDYSNATHPVTPCELPADDPTERMSSGGRCYWHRAPVIAEGCPGKIQVAGECWDDASSIYICAGYRDGKQYGSRDEYCEHSIKYTEPTITEYKCEEANYTLNGNKCERTEEYNAFHVRICPEGYTKVENDRCIDKTRTTSKVDGFICNMENAKLKGSECIIYEIIEAKHN